MSADASWPSPSSAFEVHIVAGYNDKTTVREVDPGRRIVLDAAGSMGPARVTIELADTATGTALTLHENPAGKIEPLRYLPPVQLLIRLRNAESLRRLRALVEG